MKSAGTGSSDLCRVESYIGNIRMWGLLTPVEFEAKVTCLVGCFPTTVKWTQYSLVVYPFLVLSIGSVKQF